MCRTLCALATRRACVSLKYMEELLLRICEIMYTLCLYDHTLVCAPQHQTVIANCVCKCKLGGYGEFAVLR